MHYFLFIEITAIFYVIKCNYYSLTKWVFVINDTLQMVTRPAK